MLTDIIGYMAAGFLSILFIPQVYKTFKTKETKAISYLFLILEVFTSRLFVTYGYLINSIPVILANTSTLICNFFLIFAKLKFRNTTFQISCNTFFIFLI